MKRSKHALTSLLLLALLFMVSLVNAQEQFRKEINDFKQRDSAEAPYKDPILFVGSSSFRLWPDIQSYFPHYPIINRGFGGATLPDVIYFANDVIFPYKPKQIIIYCGENDLASSDKITADSVLNRFVKLFTIIRDKMPKVPIAFVSFKPSPSRTKFFSQMIEGNQKIKTFLAKKKATAYIDVYTPMLVNGEPDRSLFREDMLHMKPNGYAIWQKAIQPYLIK